MKIGIITYHRAENYGSVLQAYALSTFISSQQNVDEVQIIDYSNIAQQRLYKLFQPNKGGIMNILRNIHTLLYLKALKIKKAKFKCFLNNKLNLSKYSGSDINGLIQYAKKYDKVVAGSDQIWNVRCADYDDNYMLSFIGPSKRIAYAPSLGVSDFNVEESRIIEKNLKNFKRISVREKSGSKFLTTLLGKEIDYVCDPVLLLSAEQWRNLSNQSSFNFGEDYILCYFIGDIPGMRKFALRVHKETGLKTIVIMKNLRDIFSPYQSKFSTGPIDFLKLIQNAKYIITDSFHAVAFSHIYEKQFWVFANNHSDRLDSLLEISGLLNRKVSACNMMNIDLSQNIDYTKHKERLIPFIEKSRKYLIEAIYS